MKCEIEGSNHDEKMNLVCIKNECQKNRLLCPICYDKEYNMIYS